MRGNLSAGYIECSQDLQCLLGQYYFVPDGVTRVLMPPATKAGGWVTFRRGVSLNPSFIVACQSGDTIIYKNIAYGAAAGTHPECTVTEDDEITFWFNGVLWQPWPNNPAMDSLLNSLFEVTYTTSGTFLVPDNNNLIVTVVGAGGGGGNTSAWFWGGSGGAGGGAVIDYVFNPPPGEEIIISVGAGGNAGVDGGNSSFGNYIVAYGGKSATTDHVYGQNVGLFGTAAGTEIPLFTKGGNGNRGGSDPGGGATAGLAGQNAGSYTGGVGGPTVSINTTIYPGGGGGGASGYSHGGSGNGGNGSVGSGGGGPRGNGSAGTGGDGVVVIKWGPKGA